MIFFSHIKPKLGINITLESIRIVLVDSKSQIKQFISIPTPPESLNQDIVVNPQKIGAVIQEAIKTIEPIPKEVSFTLPDSLVFTTRIYIEQPIDAERLEQAILERARAIIPLDFEKTYWDYREQTQVNDSARTFLYMSAEYKTVEPYQIIAKICNLSISSLDTQAHAVVKTVLKPSDMMADQDAVIILSGHTPTIYIHAYSKKYDLLFSGVVPKIDITKITSTSLESLIKPIQNITQYINDVLKYKTTKIVLLGELMAVLNIETLLSDSLKITTTKAVIDSELSPLLAKEAEPIIYAEVLGLIQNKTGDTPTINILKHGELPTKIMSTPDTEKPEIKQPFPIKKIVTYLFIATTFLGLGLIIYFYLIKPFVQGT